MMLCLDYDMKLLHLVILRLIRLLHETDVLYGVVLGWGRGSKGWLNG